MYHIHFQSTFGDCSLKLLELSDISNPFPTSSFSNFN